MRKDQYLKIFSEISKHQNRENILKIFREEKDHFQRNMNYIGISCHQQPLDVKRP